MDLKKLEKVLIQTDNAILIGEPYIYIRYNKNIMVTQVNWYYKWEKLCYWMGIFFKYYYIICENSKIPDRLSDIENFRNNISMTIGANKYAFKAIKNICSYATVYDIYNGKKKIIKWHLHWMKKNFSLDDWIELFIKIYLYNIKGVKKNLYEGLLLVSAHQSN